MTILFYNIEPKVCFRCLFVILNMIGTFEDDVLGLWARTCYSLILVQLVRVRAYLLRHLGWQIGTHITRYRLVPERLIFHIGKVSVLIIPSHGIAIRAESHSASEALYYRNQSGTLRPLLTGPIQHNLKYRTMKAKNALCL